ncbi:FLYWCH-type zinc finger-containing protein 1 isoform X2 [Acomys russatus]|uniref:FLYWCH-type zinc finger-containing protein 1 isoform X2 n=1 Tax=Acomys russatus TaxID=60746 RepID=UPI0021E252DD|nr:FLYWCH-type zinc finger-containing protein 1 isoform X2 [Acomys russatus]
MPLPEPSEQEGESVKAGQEPSLGARKPQESSNLVLARDKRRPKSKGVMSLEMSGPATLSSNTQSLPAKKQGRIIHRKRSRVDAVAPQPLEFLKTPFGGRLLVHKSFLYKQEKAVGDKVYWKCRQHSELGCRGRAITRGLRVTVMRDHCHPPDEEGLEVRRQKEKLPSSDLPEGSEGQEDGVSLWLYPVEPEPTPQQSAEPPEEEQGYRSLALQSLPPKKRPTPGVVRYRPLEFLKTCYGGTFLVHQSFLYKREKTVGSKVYWTCRDHAVHGCRSRAITQGQRVTVMRSHCHSPDMEGLQARRQQEKTIKKIQARRIGAGDLEDCDDIEDTLLQGVDSLFYRRGQGTLTLSRARSRKRAKEHQESLQEPPEEEDQDVDPRGPEFLRTPLGGSFLVYESFLYRREKAAGEKVYWTCRDQARMGCRSRAITQGQRVMVMRRHCHPPDMGGLEALRQRENFPNLTHWEGPEPMQPLEFLRTSLGGRFLVYESFLYRKEKAAGEKVYWMCRDQARLGCRSRAITQGRRVMVMRSHCHPPDLAGLEALRQREQLPGAAKRKKKGTSKSKN